LRAPFVANGAFVIGINADVATHDSNAPAPYLCKLCVRSGLPAAPPLYVMVNAFGCIATRGLLMLSRTKIAASVAAVAALFALVAPAEAACTRLGFSVNDYGKEGPTKDAQALLDKYIAQWAAERGIAKYKTGKKTVTCELFLDFIVFDEHTCKAEADVCWSGPEPTKK
jgi:hypothetical protein